MDDEAQIKRAMAAAAREVYLIADHTKWGKVASATSCRTERLTGVITDREAPAEMIRALRSAGIAVREAGPPRAGSDAGGAA
jgi:DeoR/GlpR family transcriptional regulator of sugar metabolism